MSILFSTAQRDFKHIRRYALRAFALPLHISECDFYYIRRVEASGEPGQRFFAAADAWRDLEPAQA